jgi:hypothetical protein
VLKDLKTPVSSIAVWAKDAGYKVGVTTSVSVDHATPSAFYAHQASRNSYYNIGLDLYEAGFDFYAGSDFLEPNSKNGKNLYELAPEKGYTIARGYKDFLKKSKKADKMILFQPEEASRIDRSAIPYAIDRKKGDLTLQEITRSAINFLSKDNDKGFFLMVEGSMIDDGGHDNKAGHTMEEIFDFDRTIVTEGTLSDEVLEEKADEYLVLKRGILEPDEAIIESIYLELPSGLLCSPDCRGLCPKCGKKLVGDECGCAPREIDPRWSKLKELLEDDE